MSAEVNIRAQMTLGEHLPSFQTLLENLNYILTDKTPGGLLDRKEEFKRYIEMAEQELGRVQAEFGALKGQVDVLTTLLTSLTENLQKTGVALIEFGGDSYGEVLTELGRKADLGEPVPRANAAYGVVLIANTASGAHAMQTLLGVGRAIAAPWDRG